MIRRSLLHCCSMPRANSRSSRSSRAARARTRCASARSFRASARAPSCRQYRGTNPFMHRRWDEATRLFVAAARRRAGPIRCAISAMRKSARSSRSAARSSDLPVGQRVFGTWGHRTHHVAPQRLCARAADARRRRPAHRHLLAYRRGRAERRARRRASASATWSRCSASACPARSSRRRRARRARGHRRRSRCGRREHGAELGAQIACSIPTPARRRDDQGDDRRPRRRRLHRGLGRAAGARRGDPRRRLFVAASSRWASSRARRAACARRRVPPQPRPADLLADLRRRARGEPSLVKPRLWRTAVELQHRGVLNLLPLITHSVAVRGGAGSVRAARRGRARHAAGGAEVRSLSMSVAGRSARLRRHRRAPCGRRQASEDEMELVACCGREREQSQEFAASIGAAPFTDLRRMLRAQLDLLIVTLPPFAHAGEVEQAAPPGVTSWSKSRSRSTWRGARRWSRRRRGWRRRRLRLHVPLRRGGDALGRAAKRGDTGPAGFSPASSTATRCTPPWWRERAKSGGQMVEQLIHIVDLARHQLGEPQTVYARAANLFHRDVAGYDGEDVRRSCSAMTTGASAC